ncbi:class I SAM-dependent methyltransferase [Leptolyngbya sp. AN02str]|uniref:class I SAM-dependent methyltransferase n=1 Tax=Leptolyngbya sp. AN02str TaxID=3423363 RepID=UPI003D31B902
MYSTDDLEKIRQQFNVLPYPNIPLDKSPKEDYESLFIHNVVTPHYLHFRKVPDPQNMLILDAGCGSGYKSLILAEANPGATIVGVDLSEESVKLAKVRLDYYGFNDAQFHAMPIEEVSSLGLQFDYINCDEVLYLVPNPPLVLESLRAVLKPHGILRTNLHSAAQRGAYYRAQELFRMMGLMDHAPDDAEIKVATQTMQALKPEVIARMQSWQDRFATPDGKSDILANLLLLGDKGFTVPQAVELLDAAGLEFVRMVAWRRWEVADLFEQPDDLPDFWALVLGQASPLQRAMILELMHPVNRLIDFWCVGQEAIALAGTPVDDWSEEQWSRAMVHLHPQIKTEKAKQGLIEAVRAKRDFEISSYIPLPAFGPVYLDGAIAAALLPLWDGPQSIHTLAERYRVLHPVNPITLEALTSEEAFAVVQDTLNRLDAFLYVLLETEE